MACCTWASVLPTPMAGTETICGPFEYDTVMVSPGCTGPDGSMSITVPGGEASNTSLPSTPRPRPMRAVRTSLYGRPLYASGIRLMVDGVVWVGVAEVAVGLGVVVVRVGVADVLMALLGGALLVAADCGNRMPACVRMIPMSAKRTSRISATSGQVQGLRLRRSGS